MVITFLTMFNKNQSFLQNSWELKKSTYFTGKKYIQENSACVQQKSEEQNDHELIIYNL